MKQISIETFDSDLTQPNDYVMIWNGIVVVDWTLLIGIWNDVLVVVSLVIHCANEIPEIVANYCVNEMDCVTEIWPSQLENSIRNETHFWIYRGKKYGTELVRCQ